jgi:ligand-binding SRPBCC domain-containing protein
MPVFEAVTLLACPPRRAFEFIADPANLALVTPPEMHLEIIDPPPRVALGVKLKARAGRYGIKQTMVNEVTRFEEGVGFTDEQVEGPFKKMVHSHRVDAHDGGTQLTDTFDFEAPGGLLGFVMTNDRILSELKTLAAFRTAKYKEHLER